MTACQFCYYMTPKYPLNISLWISYKHLNIDMLLSSTLCFNYWKPFGLSLSAEKVATTQYTRMSRESLVPLSFLTVSYSFHSSKCWVYMCILAKYYPEWKYIHTNGFYYLLHQEILPILACMLYPYRDVNMCFIMVGTSVEWFRELSRGSNVLWIAYCQDNEKIWWQGTLIFNKWELQTNTWWNLIELAENDCFLKIWVLYLSSGILWKLSYFYLSSS